MLIAFCGLYEALGQWNTNGNNIYNTNIGYVGIGNNSPSTLLTVAKSMTEPTITVRNLGGNGGATYTMTDDASGANWKFKATGLGGFKIRDQGNLMDVITIEANSFANAIYIKSTDNIGIGTSTPDPSAVMDVNSNTKGLLLPRLTEAEIAAISNPADGLIVYNTTDGKFYAFILNQGSWKELSFGTEIIPPDNFVCGYSLSVNHVAGNVAPVSKSVIYGTVTNVPGEPTKCWTTSNLGADHQATAANDATEASAGWYWQFNRRQGYKHDGTTRTPNTTWIWPLNENSDWLLTDDPCYLELGVNWRLPTATEWINVEATGGWTNYFGPWNSLLKLHAAGRLDPTNGSLAARGSEAGYRGRIQNNTGDAKVLFMTSSSCYILDAYKADGFNIRCIRE
ncbi:MAG: hypothetical protein KBC43_05370 [Bacteroidales bacterium]|nr:hypothetical protein [Bacteroidales bacterium]